MKRVYCLYRVSTKKQVDKNDKNENDIPMQRKACHEFAEHQYGWNIVKEFSETGISGYKVSAEDRDAIQELKEAASKNEFDVLLVFMFDRIGRIDDETPFVVEWFVNHGIEVWSTVEGQQRFDTHVDKLTNYIRFWQASGESEKTSIRIKSKMQQMRLDGQFTGGPVKLGYHLVDSGLLNRKGAVIKKYEIDPEGSELIHLIDDMTINRGYGSWRLSDYLNKKGYKTNTDSEFTSSKIIRILRDPFYCGRLPDGSTSEALQALRIRSDETYDQILNILGQRGNANEEKRHIAMNTKGKAMLSGNIFCASCGGRLSTIHYKDTKPRKDGSIYTCSQIKYCCVNKVRNLCKCEGQTTYRADIVDDTVSQIMRELFSSMDGAPEEEALESLYKKQMAANKAMQKKLESDLKKDQNRLEKLQMEISSSLTGDSVFTPEDLNQAIQTVRARIGNEEKQIEILETEEQQKADCIENITTVYNQFKSWAEVFETASTEQKKMIACNLFTRIEVGRGYKISVELNMTYQQFCDDWCGERFLTSAAIGG